MPAIERVSRSRCFGGYQDVYQHRSESLQCAMRFAIYLPSRAATERVPVVTYLSGLTCSEQNVITKGGAQRHCEEHGVVLVCPDTSPRGEDVPDDEASDLGQGAGFYVNATQAPWSKHYRMYDYVTEELSALIAGHFPVTDDRGIFGHSMGGHGALVVALSQPGRYRSVSALAPICAATQCPWGHKALSAYLGDDKAAWQRYDATELMKGYSGPPLDILVDQGLDDQFLDEQLHPEHLEAAAAGTGQQVRVRRHEGYDHSYYFISTFMGDHIAHHAAALRSR